MGLSSLFNKLFGKTIEESNTTVTIESRVQPESVALEPMCEMDEEEIIRMALNVPEVRPCLFDKTVEFWIKRISFWGKLKILYVDVDGRRRPVGVDEFERAMAAPMENIMRYGQWDINKTSVKSFEASREFYDDSGKKRKETYIVDIELDKDLEKAFKGKF